MKNPVRRLKVKLLVVQLVSIIPFLLFIFYLFDLWYDARRSMVIQQNIIEARQTSEYLQGTIKYASSLSSILATDKHVYDILASKPETVQKTLENIVKYAPQIHNIVIADTQGKPILASFEMTAEQKEVTLADRSYFQQMLTTNKPVISAPLVGRITNKPIILIASPLIIDGSVKEAVITTFNLEILKNTLDKLHPQESEERMIILDQNNQIVYATGKSLTVGQETDLFSNLPLVKKIRENKMVIIENETLPFLDQASLGAGILVEDLDWIVINTLPIKHVFAPLLKVQSVVWLIIISALLFSIFIISYFLRKIQFAF